MGTDYDAQIQATLDYIEDHLAEPMSVEGLARVACFSEFHFHRVFQEHGGRSGDGVCSEKKVGESRLPNRAYRSKAHRYCPRPWVPVP